jgi:16S rRNA (uracil1498-N3)-methyltransferase
MSRTTRIFLDQELDEKNLPQEMALPATDVHHLKNVLRLKKGAPLEVFDAKGRCFQAELLTSPSRSTSVRILNVQEKKRLDLQKGSLDVTVFQAPPGGTRMDSILRSLAELGAKKIVPVLSEFTQGGESKWASRIPRWQRLARESAKQSGRPQPLEVGEPMKFEQVMEIFNEFFLGLLLSPDPQDRRLFEDMERKISVQAKSHEEVPFSLALLVGPEGGFSEREIQRAKDSGFIAFCISPHILRSETVAPAAMAICQFMISSVLRTQ